MTAAMRHRLLFLLPFLLALSWSGDPPRQILRSEAQMQAVPVALDARDPARRQVGALTWLGGVRLTSPDPAFGGVSAMAVQGDRFLLASDMGGIVRFRMGADWQPRELQFSDLPGGPGISWAKGDSDVESLVLDSVSGRVWLGFENHHEIWRYAPGPGPAERHVAPAAMANWPINGGAEAMARLPDGGFVAISETARQYGKPGRIALRFARDPTIDPRPAFAFRYQPPRGYDPSDMAALPDGRLLVLNRRVTLAEFFTAKLVLVDPAEIRPDALVKGREIATIGPPLLRDNFEALAVVQEGGATMLWIASDDNQLPFEQTLLLKFRLDLPKTAAARSPVGKAGRESR